MEFKEEDFLQLSGLQHFAFCRRQWALIHIEDQWAENYRTVDGRLMHEHVHDQGFRESGGMRSPPSRGAWIEMVFLLVYLVYLLSRPPRGGRGLK